MEQERRLEDAWDNRRNKVIESIRNLSSSYTLRHVASIHGMTQPYLAHLAELHDIQFLDTKVSRSKRVSSRLVARERDHIQAVVHRSIGRPAKKGLIDSKKLSPELRDLARRMELQRANDFIQKLHELGKTLTKVQACKATGISPAKLRVLAYDYDIEFVDAPIQREARADHDNLEKLKTSLFKVTRSTPSSLTTVLMQYLASDEDDVL